MELFPRIVNYHKEERIFHILLKKDKIKVLDVIPTTHSSSFPRKQLFKVIQTGFSSLKEQQCFRSKKFGIKATGIKKTYEMSFTLMKLVEKL